MVMIVLATIIVALVWTECPEGKVSFYLNLASNLYI